MVSYLTEVQIYRVCNLNKVAVTMRWLSYRVTVVHAFRFHCLSLQELLITGKYKSHISKVLAT